MTDGYSVEFAAPARRALAGELPESIVAAVMEFITGPLREKPHRVGRRLRAPLDELYSARRGDYRILYRILDGVLVIEVVSVKHRRDVYRR
ncbi:type II toxin-antitoxin system RelE/ParE family toxin [Aeromicrobium sp.]|uniref:type II toxin-antitoxin system RelE family toxin n=1 Tax=Aeromicrobium sp. TaxID=1871063 RepID=UPI0028A76B49|nr:type II toxin-antitoxin system RelE/ParE family toxin [Aeromicrobium sp.]